MFVGHTRFSLFVPDSASWRASHEQNGMSADEYRDYLYDDARLSLRTNIFVNHTVPTLAQAAEDFDVKHIVSFSKSLPEPYKAQLQQAADEFDFLYLDELPDGDNGWTAVRRYFQRTSFTGTFGRYRLDDDDVLSAHYFRTTEQYIKPEFEGMLVSMPLGVEAVCVDGEFFHLRQAHTPMNSMGLLSICAVDENGTVFEPQSGPHDKSDRFAPVILDASKIGYLRAIHAGQDNAMRHEPGAVMARLMDNLASSPPFTDMAAFEAAFPTVAEHMGRQSNPLTINDAVGHGQHYVLEPTSSDAGFVIEGDSAIALTNELLVSLWIEDSRGRRVPFYKTVEGFAGSNNPHIGHFAYVPTEQGHFRAMVSLHLEHGYRLRGFRIQALSERAEQVHISRVVALQRGGHLRRVSPKRWSAERNQGVHGVVDLTIDAVYQNRTRISSIVRSTLGEGSTKRVIVFLDQLNKKLRK